MANPLRAKGTNIFVWVLMALLVIGLIGFGSVSIRGSARSIGSVGDEKVMIEDYARIMRQELQRVSQQLGQQITLQQAQAFGLDRAVLDQVFLLAAQDGEARRIGLSVGDRKVRETILNTEAFRGTDGQFSQSDYEFVLEHSGIKPAEYEESIRKDAARRLLQSAVIAGVAPPDTYVLTILSFLRETRDLRWAALRPEVLTRPTRDPSEEEIAAWYDGHKDAYTTPETRKLTYVLLTPDMVTDQVEVDPARVRALYDERSDEYNLPERRLVERLVYPDQQSAQAAWDALQAGEKSFEDLVKDRGLELNDIDLGEVRRKDLSDAAAAVIFAMQEPGVVGPVESGLGPAIFRMNGVLKARSTPFEEVADKLRQELALEAARRKVADLTANVDDLLAAGATLEEVAAETPMQLGTMDFVAGMQDGPAAYEEFRQRAAAVTKDDFPQVEQLSDGGAFALRLDEIVPPTLQPLDEVRAQVIADWKADRTMQRLRDLARTLASQIEGGTDFAAVGLTGTDATGITRQSQIEGTPPALVTDAFGVEEGKVAITDGADAVFIAQVVAVHPFDPEAEENRQLIARLRVQGALEIGGDVYEAFARAVEEAAGVTVNQAAINAVNSQLR